MYGVSEKFKRGWSVKVTTNRTPFALCALQNGAHDEIRRRQSSLLATVELRFTSLNCELDAKSFMNQAQCVSENLMQYSSFDSTQYHGWCKVFGRR